MKIKELITFRGNKKKWDRFVLKLRKNKIQVWDILEPAIDEYVKPETLQQLIDRRKAELKKLRKDIKNYEKYNPKELKGK